MVSALVVSVAITRATYFVKRLPLRSLTRKTSLSLALSTPVATSTSPGVVVAFSVWVVGASENAVTPGPESTKSDSVLS